MILIEPVECRREGEFSITLTTGKLLPLELFIPGESSALHSGKKVKKKINKNKYRIQKNLNKSNNSLVFKIN